MDLIYLELQKVAERSQTSEISCFSNLRDRISDGVSELLKSSIEPAKDLIRNVIQCELAYIKTSHPDFISGSKAVSESLEKLKRVGQETRTESNKHLKSSMSGSATVEMGSDQISSSPERSQFTDSKPHHTKFHSEFEQVIPDDLNTAEPTEREKIESEIIKTLISSYFNIIRKNVQDIVPKSIMLMMVNRCKECIQSHLVKSLYKDDLFDELLKENEDVTYKRNSCIELLTMLKKALCILNEIRELDASRL